MATATQHHHSIQMLHNSTTNGGHSIGGMPHGLGLLTTVASLPPKYRSRYLNIKTKYEIPLDLSVKPVSPQIANDVPIATNFTEVYTEPSPTPDDISDMVVCEEVIVNENENSIPLSDNLVTLVSTSNSCNNSNDGHERPITPPDSPHKRKVFEIQDLESFNHQAYSNPAKVIKTEDFPDNKREAITPSKPIKSSDSAPRTAKTQQPATKPNKNKATRKLKFDEETSSPVSGTIIRPLEDITDGSIQYSNGDIDPKYNIVEITEETKAELAAIRNIIGDYICKLCRIKFEDAFGLAQHRCACIVLLEYRCPECGKQFNCPANLASHRRWHKPKKDGGSSAISNTNNSNAKKENRNTTNTQNSNKMANNLQQPLANGKKQEDLPFECEDCGKKFKRQAYLRKHQLTHNRKDSTTNANNNANTNTNTNTKTNIITNNHSSAIASIKSFASLTSSSSLPSSAPSSTFIKAQATSTSTSTSSSSASASSSVTGTTTTKATVVLNTYPSSYATSSSASSSHSYNGLHDDDGMAYASVHSSYEYEVDSMSECSNSSTGYGRLQIIESGLTEEENIAAAALTNLRNCASVIQHTTLAH